MAEEFAAINTQEEFDARVTQLYGDVAGMQNTINTITGERDAHAKTIEGLQKQIKGFEVSALKRSIAGKKGIPPEMADRLSGETEKDIAADADAMAAIFKAARGPAPMFQPGHNEEPNAERAAMQQMLNKMKGA